MNRRKGAIALAEGDESVETACECEVQIAILVEVSYLDTGGCVGTPECSKNRCCKSAISVAEELIRPRSSEIRNHVHVAVSIEVTHGEGKYRATRFHDHRIAKGSISDAKPDLHGVVRVECIDEIGNAISIEIGTRHILAFKSIWPPSRSTKVKSPGLTESSVPIAEQAGHLLLIASGDEVGDSVPIEVGNDQGLDVRRERRIGLLGKRPISVPQQHLHRRGLVPKDQIRDTVAIQVRRLHRKRTGTDRVGCHIRQPQALLSASERRRSQKRIAVAFIDERDQPGRRAGRGAIHRGCQRVIPHGSARGECCFRRRRIGAHHGKRGSVGHGPGILRRPQVHRLVRMHPDPRTKPERGRSQARHLRRSQQMNIRATQRQGIAECHLSPRPATVDCGRQGHHRLRRNRRHRTRTRASAHRQRGRNRHLRSPARRTNTWRKKDKAQQANNQDPQLPRKSGGNARLKRDCGIPRSVDRFNHLVSSGGCGGRRTFKTNRPHNAPSIGRRETSNAEDAGIIFPSSDKVKPQNGE